jgi:hypothetical protein
LRSAAPSRVGHLWGWVLVAARGVVGRPGRVA